MPEWKSYRKESRLDYGNTIDDATSEELMVGAALRTADALEKIAQSYQTLIDERNRYENWYKEERSRNRSLGRRISALRGVITKLRKPKKQVPAPRFALWSNKDG